MRVAAWQCEVGAICASRDEPRSCGFMGWSMDRWWKLCDLCKRLVLFCETISLSSFHKGPGATCEDALGMPEKDAEEVLPTMGLRSVPLGLVRLALAWRAQNARSRAVPIARLCACLCLSVSQCLSPCLCVSGWSLISFPALHGRKFGR